MMIDKTSNYIYLVNKKITSDVNNLDQKPVATLGIRGYLIVISLPLGNRICVCLCVCVCVFTEGSH